CREFRDGQRALWEALDQWEARPISPDFDRRLYRKIEEQEQLAWWSRAFRSLRPMFVRPTLPLAATACLVLVAGFLIDGPARVNPVADSQIRGEVEQVERTLDDLDMLRQFNLAPAQDVDNSRS